MRKFSSYGAISTKSHYYVSRVELIDQACEQILGEDPDEGSHYITVWAPRQTGKTWLLQQVYKKLNAIDKYDIMILTMQFAKHAKSPADVLKVPTSGLRHWLTSLAGA